MSCKPFEASDEGLCRHVKDNVQMHCSCDKASEQTNVNLPSHGIDFSATSNGSAKSTSVKLNAGSSLTLLTGNVGGGGIGNSCPSNLQQVTH